mmetsp:Transcript_18853/g.18015  ORF Transcript_18853/g.18015 Transcript_18853/m.18015 type:complete len:91 (+) Transcript_18853:773-1045(+)|eukprot:CAMPEP_0170558064 /NCGR_PEP_ID=MMETSP0211-20121228/32442_1 /TAXON_ID=311385 /ORGANISM="Pseudokeronopsis sp., Strain OXSARD2" /LENGTH=90 /DNA_ID=CAMNT_0010869647 /DNA_START=691 /DNA_END=963 /DNA_ORIENTATION=+
MKNKSVMQKREIDQFKQKINEVGQAKKQEQLLLNSTVFLKVKQQEMEYKNLRQMKDLLTKHQVKATYEGNKSSIQDEIKHNSNDILELEK